MQMPSNTWTRWRLPSITLKWTRTVSPALKAGTSRSWRRSMLSMIVLIGRSAGAGADDSDAGRSGDRLRDGVSLTTARTRPAVATAKRAPSGTCPAAGGDQARIPLAESRLAG